MGGTGGMYDSWLHFRAHLPLYVHTVYVRWANARLESCSQCFLYRTATEGKKEDEEEEGKEEEKKLLQS